MGEKKHRAPSAPVLDPERATATANGLDAGSAVFALPPESGGLERGLVAILARLGAASAPAPASRRIAFLRILFTAVAAEAVCNHSAWLARIEPGEVPARLALSALLIVTCAAGWVPSLSRSMAGLLAALLGIELVWAFPDHANHHYLAFVCLGFSALADPDEPAERALVDTGLRALAVLGLFWAGIQKLLYGYYIQGEFLAYSVSQSDRFAAFFGLLLPGDQLARLRDLPFAAGAGPFRVEGLEALPFLAASNLSWMAELVLPLLLLHRRTREPAIFASIAFLFLLQLAARELFFAGLMSSLLLLFSARNLLPRALPLYVAGYAILVATALGWLPYWVFT